MSDYNIFVFTHYQLVLDLENIKKLNKNPPKKPITRVRSNLNISNTLANLLLIDCSLRDILQNAKPARQFLK